ncbi:MAG: histidine phosphatase family protein [Candidatus Gracilibacteria bacterium]|nr:histidine phosphatase family protein [Candidatus Gracilibacteria bacterium]
MLQAQKASSYLKSVYPIVSKIFTSPVSRATETADIIAGAYNLLPEQIEELREIDFGDMTGELMSEIPKEIDEAYFKNPYEHAHTHGESLKDVQMRTGLFLKKYASWTQDDEVFIVVTHDNVIRSLVGNIRGLTREICSLKVDHASIIVYEIKNDGITCLDFNKKI